MTNTNTQAADTAALLKAASTVPAGASLSDWNPMENIPTLSIGKEISAGQTIVGFFEGTQRLTSVKFTHSQERDPVTGLPVQYLHVFKLANGARLGIWSTGELYMVCEKLTVGELVSLTYKGKGQNSKGQAQHFFEYKKGSGSSH